MILSTVSRLGRCVRPIRRYGINQKTVAKWKHRAAVHDLPTGPREPRSTVQSVAEEAIVMAFRRHTPLPREDCLYALQPTIPHLGGAVLALRQRSGVRGDVPAGSLWEEAETGYRGSRQGQTVPRTVRRTASL
jgi:hypothetical protein